MEFNAYKSGSTKHNNFKINFSLHSIKILSKESIIIGIGILVLVATITGIAFTYKSKVNTTQHAANIITACKERCNSIRTLCSSTSKTSDWEKIKAKPDFCFTFDYNECIRKCDVPKTTPTIKPTQTPQPPIPNSQCQTNNNGASCTTSDSTQGICLNKKCFSNVYITDSKAECQKLGGDAIPITTGKNTGQYYCTDCHNRPITQDPNLKCKPPLCTGHNACIKPGTFSPGTDCKWYVCDTKGSGLWIQTDQQCTQPAPTGAVNESPTPTQTPTPTPTLTTTPTPTPTSTTFPYIEAERSQNGQCNDNTGGYTDTYTITLNYPNDPENRQLNVTTTETLDSNIDPAWVNSINNAGVLDNDHKNITWTFTLNPGESVSLTYKIDYPSQALGNTYRNTATIHYGTDSLGYKDRTLAENTSTACGNTNDTGTPTPSPTTVPNTGIINNITITIGALSTILIGLIFGL